METTRSNKRSLLIILAVVAVAALVLAMFVGTSRRADVGSAATKNWLPGLSEQVNQVDRITLTKTGDNKLTLRRGETHWHVVEKFDHRADAGQIRKLLLSMSDAKILEQKTSNPEFFSRLGLQDISTDDAPGVQVELGNTAPAVNAIVGDSARSDSGSYVRGVNDQKTYLIDQALAPSVDALSWLDRDVLDVTDNDIQSITVTQANGDKLQIAKSNTELNNFAVINLPADSQMQSESSANAAASVLTALRFDEVQEFDAEKFSGQPVVAVYRMHDGREITASSWSMPAVDNEQSFLTRLQASVNEERARRAEADKQRASAVSNSESTAGDEVGPPAVEVDQAQIDAAVADLVQQADTLNARLSPWLYKFPNHKQAHLTRRLDELLAPVPDS